MFVLRAAILCNILSIALAIYSKTCPVPQRYSAEGGICGAEIPNTIKHKVCPLYIAFIEKFARDPQNPSKEAIFHANKFVIDKLYGKTKHRRKRTTDNSFNNTEIIKDLDPAVVSYNDRKFPLLSIGIEIDRVDLG